MKLTARHLFRGHGRHRSPRVPGQITEQRFVNCPECKVETAATVHGTALLCAEGHVVGGDA
ncbi:hypothetical protein AQI95_24855 [Streptomyces yokosukanensis]|uniref:Uncharacterized protein n=1 Tax=Streptomyces yokosukanensis TaxID=67386 RepID=A0A117Q128_9ACTN|nr:hypothetical protein [Streptomyces yokosukanensis]KUN02774.1 hypothetical protein AQI95_24855 [Streptomyces yokosukanensis]